MGCHWCLRDQMDGGTLPRTDWSGDGVPLPRPALMLLWMPSSSRRIHTFYIYIMTYSGAHDGCGHMTCIFAPMSPGMRFPLDHTCRCDHHSAFRYRRIVPRPASARRVVRFLIPIDGVLFVSLVSWWCILSPNPKCLLTEHLGDRKF